MKEPLEHNRDYLLPPFMMALVSAIIASSLVKLFAYELFSIPTAVGVTCFAIVWLREFGLPPSFVAAEFALVRDLIGVLGLIAAVILVPEGREWIAGLIIAGILVFASLGYLFVLASQSFRRLIELLPLGDVVEQKVASGPLISHVSDIHITRADNVARLEGGLGGHAAVAQWLSSIRDLGPKFLVISGDITDTGDPAEWRRFEEIVRLYDTGAVVLLAPGNHDLSQEYGKRQDGKLRLFLECQSRLLPQLVTFSGEQLSLIIDKIHTDVAPLVSSRAETNKHEFIHTHPILDEKALDFAVQRAKFAEKHDWLASAWKDLLNERFSGFASDKHTLFPLKFEHPPSRSIFYILNSALTSVPTFGNSALGHFSQAQLDQLMAQLETVPAWTQNVVIVTHHPPFRRPGEWRAFYFGMGGKRKIVSRIWDYAFLAQHGTEAREFATRFSTYADKHPEINLFILCGHRHTPVIGRIGRIIALEAASLSEPEATSWLLSVEDGRVNFCQHTIHRT
jgi:hypothetical protein